ncbi:MAG TPA: dihydrodipicolinate synthase family protein [Candidatus Dormibacteraeota bacterium]|nr:dihydrodipicolinate synthase family protein [Candidatus Dormibacteraeota bacterium]
MSKVLADRSGRLRLVAATFTAMREDGSVNLDAIEAQAEHLTRGGLDGVFICGSTGESASLSSEERAAIARRWCEVAGPELLRIVHIGHPSLPEARSLAAKAQEAGADAIAALAPFYFRPRDLDQLVAFCAEVAAAAPELPFLYYHIPEMTNVRVSVPDLMRLARKRIPTFAGVKFTHTDLIEMAASMEEAGDELEIFNGPDSLLLQSLTVGVRSAVGSTYNFASPSYRTMYESYLAGDMVGALAQQSRIRRMVAVGGRHGGMPAFKAIASLAGPELGPCRLPFLRLSAEDRAGIKEELAAEGMLEMVGAGSASVPA